MLQGMLLHWKLNHFACAPTGSRVGQLDQQALRCDLVGPEEKNVNMSPAYC